MSELRTICAWCKAVIRDGESPVSHGICQPCSDRMLGEPTVRWDQIAHLRQQIERDPEAYANEAKLRVVVERVTIFL